MKPKEVLVVDAEGQNAVISGRKGDTSFFFLGATCQASAVPSRNRLGSFMITLKPGEKGIVAVVVNFLSKKHGYQSRGVFFKVEEKGGEAYVDQESIFVPPEAGRLVQINYAPFPVRDDWRIESCVQGHWLVSHRFEGDPSEIQEVAADRILEWVLGKITDRELLAAAEEIEDEATALEQLEGLLAHAACLERRLREAQREITASEQLALLQEQLKNALEVVRSLDLATWRKAIWSRKKIRGLIQEIQNELVMALPARKA